ncbi:unnamed protein product [Closterium sp. NIES-65]|nr:unnamed protein product [Closterium sp. NIES-65]
MRVYKSAIFLISPSPCSATPTASSTAHLLRSDQPHHHSHHLHRAPAIQLLQKHPLQPLPSVPCLSGVGVVPLPLPSAVSLSGPCVVKVWGANSTCVGTAVGSILSLCGQGLQRNSTCVVNSVEWRPVYSPTSVLVRDTHLSPLTTSHLSPLPTSLHFSPLTTSHLSPLLTSHHFSPLSTYHLSPLLTSHHFSPLSTYHLSPLLTSHHFSPLTTSHLSPLLTSLHFSPLTASHLSPLLTSYHLSPLTAFSPLTTSHLSPLLTSLHLSPLTASHLSPLLTSHHFSPLTTSLTSLHFSPLTASHLSTTYHLLTLITLSPLLTSHHFSPLTTSHLSPLLTSHHFSPVSPLLTSHHFPPLTTSHLSARDFHLSRPWPTRQHHHVWGMPCRCHLIVCSLRVCCTLPVLHSNAPFPSLFPAPPPLPTGPATCGACSVGPLERAVCTPLPSTWPSYCMCAPGYGMTSTGCVQGATPTVSSTSFTFYDHPNFTITRFISTMRVHWDGCTDITLPRASDVLSYTRIEPAPGGMGNCTNVCAYYGYGCAGACNSLFSLAGAPQIGVWTIP